MNTPDFIEPSIGLPLAALLTLAWWLLERHHAHKLGAGSAGADLGIALDPAPTGSTTTHTEGA